MESSEHNCTNISETIAPKCQFLASRPLGCCSFQNILTNPIISQINKLSYCISYYSFAFTINQFHNHDAQVYSPQSLVFDFYLSADAQFLFEVILNGIYLVFDGQICNPNIKNWAYLGCHVTWRSTDACGCLFFNCCREPKVTYFQVAIFLQQQIFQL